MSGVPPDRARRSRNLVREAARGIGVVAAVTAVVAVVGWLLAIVVALLY